MTKRTPKQKKFLFFDLEMTGIDPEADHIVEFAWLITDDVGFGLRQAKCLIKPEGFTIPESAVAIHGITTELALERGMPLSDVLPKFLKAWEECSCIVGHNVWHDFMFVNRATKELTGKALSRNKDFYDTGQLGKSICNKHDSNGGVVTPSLQELCVALYGCEYPNSHDAGIDTLACYHCFWELVDRGVFVPTKKFTLFGQKIEKQRRAQSAVSKTSEKTKK